MSARTGYLLSVSNVNNSELIDSKTQKTIVQHNWLKGHEFISAYGTHYTIVGLLGGGLSESWLAAFKLDDKGVAIRDSYTGRPKIERLANTPVIEQLNARGVYAPWDPRSKGVKVESMEVEAQVAEMDDEEMDDEKVVAPVKEVFVPEVSSQSAREAAEAKLLASIASMSNRHKKASEEILL